ncbi:MAG: choice-of-anchor D domain-containing protein [Mycobacterium leprae]
MTLTGTVWAPIGPSPIQSARQDNGLTTAIAINPNDGNIIYQGTAGGGVWRTIDGGNTWTPIFDRQIALGIGEPAGIAIDPNDTSTLYIGTSGRVTPQAEAGVYKSTDGGASCIRLGSGYPAGNTGDASQFFDQDINVIIVDPANSQTIYLSSDSGVFRSTDGGQNWTQGNNSGGDARSFVLDTTSPAGARILYAGITNRGVFQSTDGGQNWNPILTTATPAVANALGTTPGANFGKVVVDLAPPASPPNANGVQVLYVSLSGQGGAPDPVGLFLSTDQGVNWAQQGAAGLPTGTQNGYSFHMAVDPGSPGDGVNDIIYFGAVGQAVSTDSGANFTGMNGLHADTHAWAFFPQPAPTPSIGYSGNDGGIFRSTDGGFNWASLNQGDLQTGLFYNIAVRPDATASVTLGSLQDNGLLTTSGIAGPAWSSPQGGDGWDAAYDGVTAGRVYGSSGFWPNPCTRVFFSNNDGTDFPPTVPSGQDITPWGTASDAGCYLATVTTDPSAAGTVYVSGNQNLWQTQNAGTNWRTIGAIPSAFVTANTAVAPTNSNNVVVANGTQVSVTTNALAATVGPPNGVVFTNLTPSPGRRNLPNRNVLRAQFDPNDPTVIYAVLGGFNGGPGQTGHVFRTTIGGTAWENISPDLDVPFGGLALDGSETPTTIYVGTDLGVLRSVDGGASWTVLDDIHFPRAPVTDLVLSRQGGILRAATYGRGVFEFTRPDWPAIAVNPEAGLNFGTVCAGTHYLTLQIFNVGGDDLTIDSVQRLMGSTGVRVLPAPGTPLVIRRGEEVDFTVEFTATTPGTPETATIRIRSNDPNAPVVDLTVTGTGGIPALDVAVADSGDSGEVCLGSFVDKGLVLVNSGDCPLHIFGVSSTLAHFMVPAVVSYPLTVGAGDSIELPIRFEPTAFGPASATLTIFSDDPAGPATVFVTGTAPPPRLSVSIADSRDFGHVCVGSFRDEPLTLANSGRCPLTISSVTSPSPEFVVAEVDAYPLVVAPGTAIELIIRFQPTSFGPKTATITVTSDDPGGPRTLAVSGEAPSGTVAVTGTADFGAVELGQRAQLTLSICNVGECDLHVTRVAFKPPSPCDIIRCRTRGAGCGCGCGHVCGCGCGHGDGDDDRDGREWPGDHRTDCRHDQCCLNFTVVTNPFPATVHPGSCLGVLIQYIPTCDSSACCELVIESDDPQTPEKTLFVLGHIRRTLRSALKCWAAGQLQEILQAGKC